MANDPNQGQGFFSVPEEVSLIAAATLLNKDVGKLANTANNLNLKDAVESLSGLQDKITTGIHAKSTSQQEQTTTSTAGLVTKWRGEITKQQETQTASEPVTKSDRSPGLR